MNCVRSETLARPWMVRTFLSPSPQPSPLGRGRILGSALTNLARWIYARDGMRGSLSPRERAGVRGNNASDYLRLRICRSLLVGALAFGGAPCPAGFAASASPEGWQALAPRDELRPQFSFNPKGGPSGKGALVISTGKLEGLDGHWAKTFPVKGGQYYRFHALRRVEQVASPSGSTGRA